MDGSTPGRLLVEAIAAKDERALRALLAPDVDFRAMTPRRVWEGASADDVQDAVAQWFDDGDDIRSVDSVSTDEVVDAEHVSYRLRVHSEGRDHLVAQEAYLVQQDGRIAWLRIMCAGFRPVPDQDGGSS